ncbi:MAG TPA: sigma-70 family RNA polymerase sigma factor [Verrucomicrobiae bacterium]|nr:sigma-70 family RNA polymerase sigma factor [Verrucomicrobiae bacterium]
MNFLRPAGNRIYAEHVSSNTQQIYEQTLVLRSQLGDEAAFAELLVLHGPHLLSFTRQMMRSSPEDVDDLVQEIWLAIYRGLPRLREASRFRPWAFRIARDRIYREYRRRKMTFQPLEEAEIEAPPEVAGEMTATLDIEELRAGLDILSPEHREVLMLCFFEEMSYEEIARVTGTTLGTVRSRIHYARRALKTALERKMI